MVLDSFRRLQERDEIFIQHHISKNELVPFWAIIEVASMGTFSKFLCALLDKTPLQTVAKSLDLEDVPKLLQSGHVTLPEIALATKHKSVYVHTKTPAALLHLLAGLVDRIDYSSHLLDLVNLSEEYSIGCYEPVL